VPEGTCVVGGQGNANPCKAQRPVSEYQFLGNRESGIGNRHPRDASLSKSDLPRFSIPYPNSLFPMRSACEVLLVTAMSTRPLADQLMPGENDPESANADEGAVRARDSFFRWCGTVDAISQTPTREEKRALLEAYFSSVAEETFAPAGRFYCGSFFRGDRRTISARPITRAIEDLARVGADEIRERCEAGGDLSEIASETFAGRLPSGLSVTEVAAWGDSLVPATGTDAEVRVLRDMLARVNSLEALYLVRLIMGDFRIGVDPDDIDYAIARGRAAKASRSAAPRAQRPPEAEAR